MSAEEPIAEYVRIETGRIVVSTPDPARETGDASDSCLNVESAEGVVSIIGRICIGELSGPVLGQLCVQAGCCGNAPEALRMKLSLHRRSQDGYESLGEREISSVGMQPAYFPARMAWGPDGHIQDGGEIRFRLTISGEQAVGPFTVAVRGVSFDRNP